MFRFLCRVTSVLVVVGLLWAAFVGAEYINEREKADEPQTGSLPSVGLAPTMRSEDARGSLPSFEIAPEMPIYDAAKNCTKIKRKFRLPLVNAYNQSRCLLAEQTSYITLSTYWYRIPEGERRMCIEQQDKYRAKIIEVYSDLAKCLGGAIAAIQSADTSRTTASDSATDLQRGR